MVSCPAADAGVESATNPVKTKDKIASEDNNFFLNLLPVMPNFILNSFHEGVIQLGIIGIQLSDFESKSAHSSLFIDVRTHICNNLNQTI